MASKELFRRDQRLIGVAAFLRHLREDASLDLETLRRVAEHVFNSPKVRPTWFDDWFDDWLAAQA